ncbi:MAG TPA: hypothetical protein DEB73_03865 [Candidatus Magasanikbacteria bacterium]|nr:hypothetical protein [Candidatus Magasanikbacteria bacterium]HBX15925.1 hypothetical protein [Candidatus Magasanikbacteria bacterium]
MPIVRLVAEVPLRESLKTVRFSSMGTILNLLEKVLKDYQNKLKKHYTVISENQIRLRFL